MTETYVSEWIPIAKAVLDLGLCTFLVIYMIVRLDRTLGEMRDRLNSIDDRLEKPFFARIFKGPGDKEGEG